MSEEADWGMEEGGDEEWGVDEKDGADGDGWGDGWNEIEPDTDLKMPSATRQVSYVILDNETLTNRQKLLIQETSTLLNVSEVDASCMLRHYQWRNVKLQQDWFENTTKVRQKVGLSEPFKAPAVDRVQCLTDFCDEVNISDAFALNCGHFFCADCWEMFLTSELNKGRTCVFSTCPGMRCQKQHAHEFGCRCHEIVPETVFKKFVQDPKLLEKYDRWLLGSFVEGQHTVKWCPNPRCNRAVEYPSGVASTVKCDCGSDWCFMCQEEAHVPCPCDLVSKWLRRENTDEATEIWLAARTKKCPNSSCGVRIEKNKACNHMHCTKCGHDFCWLCKGPWSQHGSSTGGYYVCNKYKEDVKKGTRTTEEKEMIEKNKLLRKYQYYFSRYKSMKDGRSTTKKMKEDFEADIQKKQEEYMRFAFLIDACSKLMGAWDVLCWTFSLAYFLKAGTAKDLFSHQQDLLFENTQRLMDILENNDRKTLVEKHRKQIVDLTSSIDRFRKAMVMEVQRGDLEDNLLTHADVDSDAAKWACVVCKNECEAKLDVCPKCSACKLHGEMDCKACRK